MPESITRVRVSTKHIRRGVAGDCFRCAVALALQAATGDSEARIVEADMILHLVVRGRWLVVPAPVRQFVWDFDDGAEVAPFGFLLPPFTDPAWREECPGCQDLTAPEELDSEGCCEGCRNA